MGNVTLNGSTSGSITLSPPAVAGTTTINLPAISGGSFIVSDSSGNVGVGTTSPSGKLDVVATSATSYLNVRSSAIANPAQIVQDTGGTAYFQNTYVSGDAIFGTAGNNTIFKTASTERARITSGGTLLVGRTNVVGGETFGVKGSGTGATWAIYNENSAGSILHAVFNNGTFYTGGAANSPYNNTTASAANCFINSDNGFLQRSTSSLKYKTEVKDATHGLAEVMQLRPVTYKGKNDGDKIFGGLIAEEVDAVGLTEFVQYAEDGSPDALAYGNMVSLLVKSIQEQQSIIFDLKSRIAVLEAK